MKWPITDKRYKPAGHENKRAAMRAQWVHERNKRVRSLFHWTYSQRQTSPSCRCSWLEVLTWFGLNSILMLRWWLINDLSACYLTLCGIHTFHAKFLISVEFSLEVVKFVTQFFKLNMYWMQQSGKQPSMISSWFHYACSGEIQLHLIFCSDTCRNWRSK